MIKNINFNQAVELKSTKPVDISIINVLSNRFENQLSSSSRNFSLMNNADIENAVISEYEGINVKSISIPLEDDITYYLDNKFSEVEMLIKITSEDNAHYFTYYNLNKEEIGKLIIKDDIIIDSYGIINNNQNARIFGWWSNWGSCVDRQFNYMPSGTAGGSAYGLACVAYGGPCAGGVAIGCAISAPLSRAEAELEGGDVPELEDEAEPEGGDVPELENILGYE